MHDARICLPNTTELRATDLAISNVSLALYGYLCYFCRSQSDVPTEVLELIYAGEYDTFSRPNRTCINVSHDFNLAFGNLSRDCGES
jgi:hypothetical protein